jgi:hypothetical protein
MVPETVPQQRSRARRAGLAAISCIDPALAEIRQGGRKRGWLKLIAGQGDWIEHRCAPQPSRP